MKLFTLIPALCAAYVLYNVWLTKNRMSTTSKIIWSICAIFFNIITAIVFRIKLPHKYT